VNRVVCDASAVVAMLLDDGRDGHWATQALSGAELAAPQLLPFEAANVIRRHAAARLVSEDQAAQAHADLLDLSVQSWPYEVLAARSWQLRTDLTSYDGSYVALAELLDTTLVTLDTRIGRAPGIRCAITSP